MEKKLRKEKSATEEKLLTDAPLRREEEEIGRPRVRQQGGDVNSESLLLTFVGKHGATSDQ